MANAQVPFFADDPPADIVEQTDEKTPDSPLVRQLLEHSRRGNPQLAEAISSFARIGNWARVDQLLSQLSAKQVDASALAQMQQTIGPAVFLRIKTADLSDAAKSGLAKLAAAAITQAESPQRLRSAIAELGSDDVDVKLSAARTLFAGGNVAIQELVAAVVVKEPVADRDELLRAMLKFGPGGIDALRQLALYGNPAVRHQALRALARIDRSAHVSELLTALYASDASELEVGMAGEQLSRLGDVPSRASAIAILALDLQQQTERARLIDNDEQLVTTWSVDKDPGRVNYQNSLAIHASYRDAADASARLRRIGNLSPSLAPRVLNADVAYRVMIDPDWGDPAQIDAVRQSYREFAWSGLLATSISESLAEVDHPATVGLLRLVDSVVNPIEKNLLLRSGTTPTPLARAATEAKPRIRYEAALAAARLAGGQPYAGSSRVMRCLSEMRRLDEEPSVILVETRPNVVIQLELILGRMGYGVTVVGSVSGLQRCVNQGGDLRMILSKTELADLPAVELVDMVRRLDRGRELPIVFFGADPAGLNEDRWQAATLLIDRPASPAAFDELLDHQSRRQRLSPLSPIERAEYRRKATELLGNASGRSFVK